MSVRIDLDNAQAVRTNYDIISGRICISLRREVKISAILVKLEGESRSELEDCSSGHGSKGGIRTETHKILYKMQQILPKCLANTWDSPASFTLQAGKHEFAFSFQIPLENDCADLWRVFSKTRVRGIRLASIRRQLHYEHLKQALPPSLTGLLGLAEIKYFIKVTIRQASLFKENWKSSIGFKFLPFHLPRPLSYSNVVCTKVPYTFKIQRVLYAKKEKLENATKRPYGLTDAPPKGELEARLPQPSILMCNQPIPLRLILRKLNSSPDFLVIVSCTVHILVKLKVRVNEVVKFVNSSWVLANLNGLSVQIGSPNDREGTECIIDNFLWNSLLLPSTVSPSFQTCNLSRNYELEVRIELGYGIGGEFQESNLATLNFLSLTSQQPQIISLPLRLPVDVCSSNSSTSNFENAHDPALFHNMSDSPPSYEDAIAH